MGNQASSLDQPGRSGAVVSGPSASHRVGSGTGNRTVRRGKSFMESTLAKECDSWPTRRKGRKRPPGSRHPHFSMAEPPENSTDIPGHPTVPQPTPSAFRPADRHGTRSPSPGRPEPPLSRRALKSLIETSRPDPVSNETLRPLPASEPRADRRREQTDAEPDFRLAEELVAKTRSLSPASPETSVVSPGVSCLI